MFGRRKLRPEPDGSAPARERRKRDRLGSAMFKVLGPATVQGALQGHSPEVRRAWKELQERNRRARREAGRGRDADGAELPPDS